MAADLNVTGASEAELELQRCEEEERRLAQRLAEMQDLPKRIKLEKQEYENTLPPCGRLTELDRIRSYEEDLKTRRETGNLLRAQTRSLLLVVALGAAIVALFAWGLRLMNGG